MADWALIKNHAELWKDLEPQYFYVQSATVESMETAKNNWRYHVRLVLLADHPGIFRVGDIESFPDVSAEDLNYVVAEMIEVEREKARTALTMTGSTSTRGPMNTIHGGESGHCPPYAKR